MFGTVEVVKEFIHARKRVAVLDGDSIDGTVIDTKAEGAIGLASEKDGGTKLGYTRADPTLFKVDLDLLL